MKTCFLFLLFALCLPETCIGQTCDPEIAKHVYHPDRLKIAQAMAGSCITVAGVWMDASHGKWHDHCRHEKDGDAHCWLKPDEDKYINAENRKSQDGNLVVEPVCRYFVSQPDAKAACKGFKQKIFLPKPGDRVRVTGVWVLDTAHGHMEIHPVSKIEVIE
jgi:hypothetical protein